MESLVPPSFYFLAQDQENEFFAFLVPVIAHEHCKPFAALLVFTVVVETLNLLFLHPCNRLFPVERILVDELQKVVTGGRAVHFVKFLITDFGYFLVVFHFGEVDVHVIVVEMLDIVVRLLEPFDEVEAHGDVTVVERHACVV
jgi:hypothetical protein